jgi:hypothetical protein
MGCIFGKTGRITFKSLAKIRQDDKKFTKAFCFGYN